MEFHLHGGVILSFIFLLLILIYRKRYRGKTSNFQKIVQLFAISVLIFAGWSTPMVTPARAASVAVATTSDISDGDTSSIGNLIANPGPDGVISLREAIAAANNTSGADTISFNIPDCGGVCTIQPVTPLPVLSGGGTTIDGYTQPGALPASDSQPAVLLLELDGSLVTEFGANGIEITSSNNQVYGLVINRWVDSAEGIAISGSDAYGNLIAGNYIGIDASGTMIRMNSRGVLIEYGAHDNTIGGDHPADRNIISGNHGPGVTIQHGGANANIVSGNYIGTDVSGTQDLGNGLDGVVITGDAKNNRIGGSNPGDGNLISGNGQSGIWIHGYATYLPSGNQIVGNYIGTDVSGTVHLGNMDDGITIWGGQDTLIQGNVISDNGDWGIYLITNDFSITGNEIYGNFIGTDPTGTLDQGNLDDGIYISSHLPLVAQNNIIGGLQPGMGNVISCNHRNGIFLKGAGTSGNPIIGNIIGTDQGGTLDLGNRYNGILADLGVTDSVIGPDNLIAYNETGIKLSDPNIIGVQVTQNSIYENTLIGIDLSEGANNDIPAPSITAVSEEAPSQITGSACQGCDVEIFASPTGDGQGKRYLGTTIADGSGQFTLSIANIPLPYLTATATDVLDGTSEFSPPSHVEIERWLYLPILVK